MKVRFAIAVSFFVCSSLAMAQRPVTSPLDFTSSNSSLQQSFTWAKKQALAYARDGSSTIGPWYEAALPGRNAFCMRDVSHQVEGAAALGLYQANRNMLERFARSAAKSRDWAAYWEIDESGEPSPADYVSDNDFWFNLPANFDLLDAAVRLWRWTGDDTYRDDPAFRRFFRVTMSDYIERWQLEPSAILGRPRIANQRQAVGRFVNSRGIPSYIEGPKDFIFGTDLLGSEYRATQSFEEIAVTHSDRELAERRRHTADNILALLDHVAWSKTEDHYMGTIRKDLSGAGSGDGSALYFGAVKNPVHLRGALDYISSPVYWSKINVEEESYVPLTLFRYGRNDAAYKVLRDISGPEKKRREYPEVSYAVIEAIVSGVMGIKPGHGGSDFDVFTISRLAADSEHATLSSVSIKQNRINVTHLGGSVTTLKNVEGPLLRWRAAFRGNVVNLNVNGRSVPAQHSTMVGGAINSWTDVVVPSGGVVTVHR